MRLNSMLISSFLFASVVLAGPSQFHRQNLAQNPANASSDTVTYLSNWAGAVYGLDSGSFNFISGTVTVPHISGPTNSSVDVVVGIDGTECFSMLAAGVEANVTSSGPSYQAWCYFNDAKIDLNVAISAGDLVRFTVKALDKTSGLVVVENLSNNQMDYRPLQSSDPLCELSAVWLVELVSGVHTWLPLANFSPVTFTDAVALDHNGRNYGPQGANMNEILNKDGKPATSVSLGEYSVTIERV